MSLIKEKESIALEVFKFASDSTIGSNKAAIEINNYLFLTYPNDTERDCNTIDNITEIIKEYRNGLSLESATAKIIGCVETDFELDTPLSSYEGDLRLQGLPSLPLLPTVQSGINNNPSVYYVGMLVPHITVCPVPHSIYNNQEWIDCLGQEVMASSYQDLYWHIKSDITMFELGINLILSQTGNFIPYVFTERVMANGGTSFNIPLVPDYFIRAVK